MRFFSKVSNSVLLLLIGFLISSCSTVGTQEFEAYNVVFAESESVTIALIDQLSIVERASKKKSRLATNSFGIDFKFSVEDAGIFSDLAEPPLTTQYRKAFAAISQYNQLMLAYATGQGFDNINEKIFSLANSANQAANGLGVGESVASFVPYLTPLKELSKLGFSQKSKAVFRTKAIEYHEDIVILLKSLRDGAEQMFPFLTNKIQLELRGALKSKSSTAEIIKRHDDVRVMLSDWVILMNMNIEALEAVKIAITNPTQKSKLKSLDSNLFDLYHTAKTVKQHLTAIKAQ